MLQQASTTLNSELHVISTGKQSFADLALIAGSIYPYITAFHLREKTKTARELLEGIELLLAAGVPRERIVINDRADVAAAAGVRGVHLAYHSLDVSAVKQLFPQLRVGKSVHSREEAVQAESEGADYVLFGHVFATGSKPGLAARGTAALELVAACVGIPVIAIGGIKPARVSEVLRTGAAGVAVMSGILEAPEPLSETKIYHQCLHEERQA